MEKILDGLKTGIIWSDNVNVDANAIVPMDVGNMINNAKASTVSIMDLGKMLLLCAKEGDTAKVHELMSRGAPFTTDWLGTSPLHMAAMSNHLETCEVLLRAGISKDARTKVDRTPLHFAVYEGHESIVELLLKNNCDVNARDMLKMTPLHWAVEKHHSNLVTLLLKYGADPNAMSKFNKSPISLAAEKKLTEIFQELISHNDIICQQEHQDAADSLMFELEKDNYRSMHGDDIDAHCYSQPENKPHITSTAPITNVNSTPKIEKHDTNASKTLDSLQILKDHGISMLPEDNDNSVISSALQSGLKLQLSDVGKQLILNYSKSMSNPMTPETIIQSQSNLNKSLESIDKRKSTPALVMTNNTASRAPPLKTNKVIKILSAEEFNKMCAAKVPNATFRKVSQESINNGFVSMEPVQPSLFTNLTKVNRKAVVNKCRISPLSKPVNQLQQSPLGLKPIGSVQQVMMHNNNNTTKKFVLKSEPPQLVISSTNSLASSTNSLASTSSSSTQNLISLSSLGTTANTPSTSTSTQIKLATSQQQATISIPKNTLNDIMRQLFDLKKQTDDLRKQMDLYQKQNEDYRLRIERLERERENSTRKYTNSNF